MAFSPNFHGNSIHQMSASPQLSSDMRSWQEDSLGGRVRPAFSNLSSSDGAHLEVFSNSGMISSPRSDVASVDAWHSLKNLWLPRYTNGSTAAAPRMGWEGNIASEKQFMESLTELQQHFSSAVLRLHRRHVEMLQMQLEKSKNPTLSMDKVEPQSGIKAPSAPKADLTIAQERVRDPIVEREPSCRSDEQLYVKSAVRPSDEGQTTSKLVSFIEAPSLPTSLMNAGGCSSVASRPSACAQPHESVLKRRIETKGINDASYGEIDGELKKVDSAYNLAIDASDIRCIVGDDNFARHFMDRLTVVVQSASFELFFGAIILLNTALMSCNIQYIGMKEGHKLGVSAKPPEWLQNVADIGDDVCLWLFVAELLFKFIGWRKKFFIMNRGWNFLDTFIVGFGIVDRFASIDIGIDPMVIRLLRLLKLARFAKMFKLLAGSLHAMNLILKSVSANINTLIWSMLLLFMIQIVTGIVVSQMCAQYIKDDSNPKATRELIYKYYGTMTRCQFTMFEITHVSYALPARALVDSMGEYWMLFFCGHRLFVAFAFLQVIKAVFIQSTLKVASHDRDLVIHSKKTELANLLTKLGQIFFLIDKNGQGTITLTDFKAMLKQESTKIWLSSLDIDCTHPEGLFELLDLDGTGSISCSEFQYGAAKLRGVSTQRDMFSMQALNERIEAKLNLLLPPALRVKKHPHVVLDSVGEDPASIILNGHGKSESMVIEADPAPNGDTKTDGSVLRETWNV